MPVSAGAGKHEPPQPRKQRPEQQRERQPEPQQPESTAPFLPLSLPLSLPHLSLPRLIHSRPAPPQPELHRLSSTASQGDSSRRSHGDGCRAPAGPMEEPQGNTLVVRIGIPDLQQTLLMIRRVPTLMRSPIEAYASILIELGE
ncbi:hypothetical protein SRHO_G00085210 [Serrasalmus rhombeus]